MIKSKQDLARYIEQDRLAEKRHGGAASGGVRERLNPRLRFIRNLRYYEYYHNQEKKSMWTKMMELYHYYVHKQLSYKLGFTIYANQFGPGLFIGHYGTIVINKACRIGANCVLNVDVNIGMGGSVIGDNCYISPGAKIVKPVNIGNNVVIGANAVVNKDIPANTMVAGIPAKVIKRYNEKTSKWERI